MALIGLTGLTIGTLVFLELRPVEPPMTGALAAMIFSIPALHGIMPGVPPLGIHADALISVWVQLAVIIGLTLFVVTWVRGSARRRRRAVSTRGYSDARPAVGGCVRSSVAAFLEPPNHDLTTFTRPGLQ